MPRANKAEQKINRALAVRESVTTSIAAINPESELILTEQLRKAIGPSLVKAARNKRANIVRDSLLACTEDFLRQKEIMNQRIFEAKERIKQIDARLADIEAGKFELNQEARIIFPHLPPPHIG